MGRVARGTPYILRTCMNSLDVHINCINFDVHIMHYEIIILYHISMLTGTLPQTAP